MCHSEGTLLSPSLSQSQALLPLSSGIQMLGPFCVLSGDDRTHSSPTDLGTLSLIKSQSLCL